MTGLENVSANALADEIGVSQPTLSRWKREARTVRAMGGTKKQSKDGGKSPRQWSAKEKLQVVLEAADLSDEELGEFLRRKGLHTAQLEEWHKLATEALTSRKKPTRKKSPEVRRIKELERELLRKDRALAEVAALLALKKKPRRSGGTRTTTQPRAAGPDPRMGRRSRHRWSQAGQGL